METDPPVVKTLDRTVAIYREHLRTFLMVSALVWVPATLLQAFVQRVAAHAFEHHLALNVAAGLFPAIPLAIAFFVQSAAIDVAVAQASLGQRPSVEGAYVGALNKIVPIFVVTLLYTLVIAGGAMLFIVPAFVFMCRYAFALPMVIVEGVRPLEAMSRSAVLTHGRKGRLFLIFLVIGAANGFLASVAQGLFGGIPVVGTTLAGLPGMLTAALCPIAIMLEYLSAKEAADAAVLL